MKAFLLILLTITSFATLNAQDRTSDSLALVEFYEMTNGENWTDHSGWLTTAPLDEWYGVSTNGARVTKINITNNNLVGSLPSSLYGMNALEEFFIFNAELNGQLSEDLYQLQNLRVFGCSFCGLSGQIPGHLDTLHNLENVRLDRNNFTGTLPDLPEQVNFLKFDSNDLEGGIPESWTGLEVNTVSLQSNLL